jgi:hypothetical protein
MTLCELFDTYDAKLTTGAKEASTRRGGTERKKRASSERLERATRVVSFIVSVASDF